MLINEQFIKLGHGYGDIYELFELMKTNQTRIHNAFLLITEHQGKAVCSFAVALKPAGNSQFMPIYICLEGIPYNPESPSKRLTLFEQNCEVCHVTPIQVAIKHSSHFEEYELYYQYVTGILRLNHLLPPLQ